MQAKNVLLVLGRLPALITFLPGTVLKKVFVLMGTLFAIIMVALPGELIALRYIITLIQLVGGTLFITLKQLLQNLVK